MKNNLHIGKSVATGKPFYVDIDASSMTWGTIAMKGNGKTYAAGEAAGINPKGSTLTTYISRLRRKVLIDGPRHALRLADSLASSL